MPAVEASGLVKRFGDTIAVDGVDLVVEEGEIFGILGPDGAGKTTLFRVLVTLLLPDAGRARVDGHDVVDELPAVRARVGYMPGRFSLYPDLSIRENLEFFAAVFGTRLADARELIEPVYHMLEPYAERRAGALSGGMKQKLALCCALVHRPRVLFLDEPTTGIDAVSRRELWDLLSTLPTAGISLVVSTPYMDEARRCHRVALMDRGRFLAVDTPATLTSSYPHPLFAVRAGGPRSHLLARLRGLEHAVSAEIFGDAVHYADRRHDTASTAIAIDVANALEAELDDVSVEPIEASIEDVFIELAGSSVEV